MLMTNLEHIESVDLFNSVINENENVMICCGRMGPMCLPVYDIMSEIKDNYDNVTFMDMDFDTPCAMETIRNLPECAQFRGLPFTVYFKNGKAIKATSSIQSTNQVVEILGSEFKK